MKSVFREITAGLLVTLSLPAATGTFEPVAKIPQLPYGFYRNTGQLADEFLFVSRSLTANVSLTATSIVFGMSMHRLILRRANPNAEVRLSDPLPGIVNIYATQDPTKWARGLKLYKWVEFVDILPNVDERFEFANNGQLSVRLICRPGCDARRQLEFEYRDIEPAMADIAGGGLGISWPSAMQDGRAIGVEYEKRDGKAFGFRVSEFDPSAPVTFTIPVYMREAALRAFVVPLGYPNITTNREVYASMRLADAAGQPERFAAWRGHCYSTGGMILYSDACNDGVVYRFTSDGELIWASYLGGTYMDSEPSIKLSDDAVVVAGQTESPDFPVTQGAYSMQYPGSTPTPSPCCWGGAVYLAQLDRTTGVLKASSFVGLVEDGPIRHHVGADGSAYVLWSNERGAKAVQFDSKLSSILKSIPLPAGTSDFALDRDGSLVIGGVSAGGVPVTDDAYRKEPAGEKDVFVARLDPSGRRVDFATYLGVPNSFQPFGIQVDPDGGVWMSTRRFAGSLIEGSTIHINAKGSNILARLPFAASYIHPIADGSAYLLVDPPDTTAFAVGGAQCGEVYARVSPTGKIAFASSVAGSWALGYTLGGHPVVARDNQVYQLKEDPSLAPFPGCVEGGTWD